MSKALLVAGFDVDYTLVEWLRRHGLLAAAPVLQQALPHLSVDEIIHRMDTLSMALLTGETATRETTTRRVMDAFARHVRTHTGDPHPKEVLWSQVSKSSLVCEDVGVDPREHYKTLVDAEHAFWDGVAANSGLYSDAAATIRQLRDAELDLFALTSSDARVALHRGAPARPGPHPYYSASIARAKKLQRFANSGLFDLLPAHDVIVCDPWHKEDAEVWRERVFPRFHHCPDRSRMAFVGDSRYDMVAASNVGIGVRIFVNRHKTEAPHQATHTVDSLTEAAAIILQIM